MIAKHDPQGSFADANRAGGGRCWQEVPQVAGRVRGRGRGIGFGAGVVVGDSLARCLLRHRAKGSM